MIKEAIEKVMNEYPAYDVKQVFPFAGSPLAEYIRHDLPEMFSGEFNEFPGLVWEASPGKGQWADAPWMAALNPLVTETAQDGYYPVLLFTSSLDAVYLSLNQGMTKIRQQSSDDEAALNTLRHRADLLRRRLGDESPKAGFSAEPIDLQPRGQSTRIAHYEPGHAFGKRYKRNQIPPDDVLKTDVLAMLRLYALAFSRGGVGELDLDDQTPDPSTSDLGDLKFEERLQYKNHLTIERNRKLVAAAKRLHGYTCQVCGFNFGKQYGPVGEAFIEAHHKVPMAMLPKDRFVTLSAQDDFAVVCSNCHSMLHRRGSVIDFDQFVRDYQANHPNTPPQ